MCLPSQGGDLQQRSSGIWDCATRAFCHLSFCCARFHRNQRPVTSAVLGFCYCSQLSLSERSPYWASALMGFRLTGRSWGIHPGYIWCNRYVRRRCRVLKSQSHHKEELKKADQCYTLVATQSLFGKRIVHLPRHEGGPTLRPIQVFFPLFSGLLSSSDNAKRLPAVWRAWVFNPWVEYALDKKPHSSTLPLLITFFFFNILICMNC